MAIKIRCTECRKKISIDEAFAGGMCRCPYCKAIVYVPEDKSQAEAGARPAVPTGRPDVPTSRPAAPGAVPPAPPGAQVAVAEDHIPMAKPVKIQGIITIVLLALLVIMVAAGVTLALMYVRPPDYNRDVPDDTQPVRPLEVSKKGPAVAGIQLDEGDVVYLLDGGSTMQSTFDGAVMMTENSVLSLTDKGKFTILVSGEEKDRFLFEESQPGGEGGQAKVMEVLRGTIVSGASNLPRALKAALAKKPRTIVLIARKVVDDAAEVVKEARQQGVKVHTISLDGDSEVKQSMKALAEITGGEARAFTISEL
jgi:phage FluMu protein Com